MSRSKFVFRVRDVIRFVMRKSSLDWKEYPPHYIQLVSNAFKREKENESRTKKHSHIRRDRVQLWFLVALRARYWLLHSLSLSLDAHGMSYHLLSWILVFSRISAISRNDSSFVCFIFFAGAVVTATALISLFFARFCCCLHWSLFHFIPCLLRIQLRPLNAFTLQWFFRHNGSRSKSTCTFEESAAFAQHCNLFVSICSLNSRSKCENSHLSFRP